MPRFRPGIVKMLRVPIKSELKYSLPIEIITEDMKVVHSYPLPKFASFESLIYTFNPKKI